MFKLPLKSDPKFNKLKMFLDVLDPDRPSSTGKERHPFCTLLIESSRRYGDYFHCVDPHSIRGTVDDIIPRFMHLLRECVLTHQWDKAAKIIEAVSMNHKTSDSVIAKVGMASLMQIEDGNSDLLRQFMRQAAALRDVGVVEVFVEYLLHVMTHGDLDAAQELVHDLKKCTPYKVYFSDPRRVTAQVLFDSYQGLVLYARWKEAVFQQERMMQQEGGSPSLDTLDPPNMADQAIEAMQSLQTKSGVWDVFLTRVVEMQVYHGKIEEARTVLENYAKTNPSNPNVHRYLYEFEVNHNLDSQNEEIKHLRNLINLDPCNPLCVELYSLEETDPNSVGLLFDYLDFSHCSDDEKVLQLLSSRLDDVHSNFKLKIAVKKCWEIRSSWWPHTVLKGSLKRHHSEDENSDADVVSDLKRSIYKRLCQFYS